MLVLFQSKAFLGRLFSYLSDLSKRLGFNSTYHPRSRQEYNLISFLMAYKNELVLPSKEEWEKLVHKENMEYEVCK